MFVNIQIGDEVTARVRLIEPLNLMKKLYNVDYERIKILNNNTKLDDKDGLFLIRARVFNLSVSDEIFALKILCGKQCLLLHEMDDSPRLYDDFYESKQVDFIASHAITCSTEVLAEEFREFNPFVKVFKNQIAELLPERNFEKKDYVTIFFGAINRKHSWQDIMPVLNKFAKKYKGKLRFVVINDLDFFQNLNTQHKTLISDDIVPYDVYIRELQKADIALLPLNDTPYTRAKSDLKFLESGNAGCAVIASPTIYESVIKDGENGFIYRNPREFQTKLNILITDSTKRVEIAKSAYNYIKNERLLVNHIEERYDWMKEMYQRRDELYKASLLRLEANFG